MEQFLKSEKREVLIAVDNSEGSTLAVQWALKNYCKPHDHIRLIHVRKNYSDISGKIANETMAKLEEQSLANARAVVERYMRICFQADFNCDWKIASGDERESICKEVLRVCADVLIIGSRGLSAVKRALLGSISEYCAHHCACPVIIVKGKEEKG